MRAMQFICLFCVFALIVLSGCNQNSLIEKFASPEDKTTATKYIALLRQKQFEPIERDLDPSLKSDLKQDTLEKMANAIPTQEPVSVKIVGAYSSQEDDIYKDDLTFEYEFPTNWLLINVATQKKSGVSTIIGFNVYEMSDSLENLNKFTLAGKNLLQYAMLAFAILVPLFIVYTLVLCIRTKMKRRKWLWIIFILIGIGKFTVNWTNGHVSIGLLYFQLLGASSFAPPYGAWLISVSLPLGAILFLVRHNRLIAPVESPSN
ncbi:MAG TPA: hypothetical protein VNU95_07975 [Candidatus Acidoferrales bacterium]|nr:hypothetical protein [Candidatus Acidoferrales bacterium]